MNWEQTHLNAIATLIEQRGGFETIELEHLSNAIALADVFIAFKQLSHPRYSLRIPTARLMSHWPYPDPDHLHPLLRKLGTGFEALPIELYSLSLSIVIDYVRHVSIGYELCLDKDSQMPRFVHVIWGRNCLIHDLLSLPDRSVEAVDPESCLYELCRLGVLAYMLLVLFPLPRISGLHLTLASRLSSAIVNASPCLDEWTTCQPLTLWATVMGGILAEDNPEWRTWYIDRARRLNTDEMSWQQVKNDICACFLWLERECDEAGENLWFDVSENVSGQASSGVVTPSTRRGSNYAPKAQLS
jgi:hypothetical protein